MGEKRKIIQDFVDEMLDAFRDHGVPVVIVWTGDGGISMDVSSNAKEDDAVRMIDHISACMKTHILQPAKPEIVH